MKIFTAAQIRACDAYSIHASGKNSIDLMEHAASRCADWIMQHLPKDNLFVALCGAGNNGGDGLAITRILHRNGYGAKAFLLPFTTLSHDCKTNLERLQLIDESLVEILKEGSFISGLPEHIVLIDALLGTGLSRPAEGWIEAFIRHINQLPNRVISIDTPSGLPADTVAEQDAAIVYATDTLTFQFYKRSFLHPETGAFAGNIHLLDIGLNETFIHSTTTHYQIIDKELLKEIYRPRLPFSHKGTYGNAHLIGGSFGMMGAIGLAARAAGRAGAGKVRALIPGKGYSIFQGLVPEAMCLVSGEDFILEMKMPEEPSALGIGPGLGTKSQTIKALETLIDQYKKPMVLDADALNILAQKKDLLHKLPHGSIITPHPKEFERLLGAAPNSMMRLENARTQAMRYNITIVMKDHYTVVVNAQGECWYNVSANAALATAGSGDVLMGMITALAAQGYGSAEAAILAVYLHGKAGQIASKIHSEESVIAGDITEHIGAAFKTIC